MVQTKRKTSIVLLAVVICLALLLGLAQIVLSDTAVTAQAAGTRALDTITIADMYANKDTGTYGNYSWDPSKLKEITNSSFTIKASVAVGYQPFYICWTKPSGTASPTKLRYGYTPGADVTKQSASKGLENTLPTDNRASGGNYAVEEITLYGNNDTMYFYFSSGYMYEDIVVTSVTFQPKVNTVKVSATAGTGVQSVYLSKDQNATSGSNSGTNFDKGDTVYAFAMLAEGYKHPNAWTLVSGTADTAGAIYRVSSSTMGTSDYSFGTINAAAKTKSLTRNTNGAGYLSNLTLTYGQTANLTVPTRNGYNFLGWNTKADGTGATYGNESSATLTASQVNAIIDDSLINTVYAMWRIGKDTVIGFINDIPDPVVYTQACKDAIDTARGGYNDLSAEDKDLVTNYDKLTEAEGIYAGMQSDKEALDAYKITKKADADDLAEMGDSAACAGLISDAKTAINAVVYDCTKTLDENKAVVDAIVADLADALDLQRDKDAFEAYKVPQKSAADALAAEGDSAACEKLITDAKADIDALIYDENKTLEKNKEDVEAIVDALAGALIAQRNGEAADVVDGLIDAIPSPVVYPGSKNAIDAAREAYDALTSEQKSFVDDLSDLEAAEAAYAGLKADNDAAEAVDELIDAITAPVTYPASKEAIEAARNAYDALTLAQKALVSDLEDLEAAEAAYVALEDEAKAQEVIALIEAIGTVEYTDESKAKIDAAKEAYASLSVEQKSLVANHATLPTAEITYNNLADQAKANEVKALIAAIGEVKYPDSKEAIHSARTAYDDLTDVQKAKVDNYDLLTAAEEDYAALEVAANKKLSGGAIAGIVIGCVFGVLLIAFIVLFLLYKRDQDKEEDKKLIKMAWLNDVMGKVDAFIGKIGKKSEKSEDENADPKDE